MPSASPETAPNPAKNAQSGRNNPNTPNAAVSGQKPKSLAARIFAAVFAFCFVFFFLAFSALGIWQVKRLAWKEDLIARVNARIHLPPVPAPAQAQWAGLNAEKDDYRPVRLSGVFLHDKEILVKASVLLNPLDESGGAGYWVMTPLKTAEGAYVFINRGFVPLGREKPQSRAAGQAAGEAQITGLLRMSEGAGALFNKNDPQHHIWFSRQISALSAAEGLPGAQVAPYFIDADAAPNLGGWPRGGLTVIDFPNNHLVYAITWFSGAAGLALAGFVILRGKRREKHKQTQAKGTA